MDESLEEAARNLGAKTYYIFFRVMLPILLPTVLGIFALNFNSLLGDYDVSVFLYHPVSYPADRLALPALQIQRLLL